MKGTRGWTTTVGELRAALEGVPDDYEVMLDGADVEECDISGVSIRALMPPVETDDPCELDDFGWCINHGHAERVFVTSPGLLVLNGGQVLSSEYAYHQRLDKWLDQDGGHWKDCALHDHELGWTEYGKEWSE